MIGLSFLLSVYSPKLKKGVKNALISLNEKILLRKN
ncbi:hypothetical protein WwAna0998 [Wolbachia endosymbiont of Drosophila ananassae]|nr:hypothetical protein WwAna0998 [Wolbachia endosymbiont of Drosophila ananassae]